MVPLRMWASRWMDSSSVQIACRGSPPRGQASSIGSSSMTPIGTKRIEPNVENAGTDVRTYKAFFIVHAAMYRRCPCNYRSLAVLSFSPAWAHLRVLPHVLIAREHVKS